jgi:hypothetical protein
MRLWKEKYEAISVSKHHTEKILSEVKDKFQSYVYVTSGVGVRWSVPRFTFS